MPQLKHRIDLALLISVDNANPNGDPLNRGLPRRDRFGRGVISAVCIKRKLRNALEQMGQEILISPPEYPGDDLAHRLSDVSRRSDMKDEACRRWFDVRAFGQTFAVRGCNFSGIRGAVSLQSAVSVCPVRIVNQGITSCFSGKKKLDRLQNQRRARAVCAERLDNPRRSREKQIQRRRLHYFAESLAAHDR